MLPILAAMWLTVALDAAAPSAEPSALPPPGPEAVETHHDLAYRIGKDIRCPVCQGMSIAESPSAMAQDMMGRVRGMLKEGRDADDVRAYFVQRYGVWVLLDPPKEGFLLLVWLVPPVVLVGAGALALRHMRRLRTARVGAAPAAGAPAAPAAFEPAAASSAPALEGGDAYLQALRDEVRR